MSFDDDEPRRGRDGGRERRQAGRCREFGNDYDFGGSPSDHYADPTGEATSARWLRQGSRDDRDGGGYRGGGGGGYRGGGGGGGYRGGDRDGGGGGYRGGVAAAIVVVIAMAAAVDTAAAVAAASVVVIATAAAVDTVVAVAAVFAAATVTVGHVLHANQCRLKRRRHRRRQVFQSGSRLGFITPDDGGADVFVHISQSNAPVSKALRMA